MIGFKWKAPLALLHLGCQQIAEHRGMAQSDLKVLNYKTLLLLRLTQVLHVSYAGNRRHKDDFHGCLFAPINVCKL